MTNENRNIFLNTLITIIQFVYILLIIDTINSKSAAVVLFMVIYFESFDHFIETLLTIMRTADPLRLPRSLSPGSAGTGPFGFQTEIQISFMFQ